MSERRPMGSLEESVIEYLWTLDGPATPGEVHDAVGEGLAYTTVMTILTRLWKKGRLERKRAGRAYTYWPVSSEAEHRADHMAELLSSSHDAEAVLSRFVGHLAEGEADALRRMLKGQDSSDRRGVD